MRRCVAIARISDFRYDLVEDSVRLFQVGVWRLMKNWTDQPSGAVQGAVCLLRIPLEIPNAKQGFRQGWNLEVVSVMRIELHGGHRIFTCSFATGCCGLIDYSEGYKLVEDKISSKKPVGNWRYHGPSESLAFLFLAKSTSTWTYTCSNGD